MIRFFKSRASKAGEIVYKNIEKKINTILNRLLLSVTTPDDSMAYHPTHFEFAAREIKSLLNKRFILSGEQQAKVLQILSTQKIDGLIGLLKSKDYQHLCSDVAKLLTLYEPHFSYEIIEVLCKMEAYQFVSEVIPFSKLSIDDKLPLSEISYRDNLYVKYPNVERSNSSFKYLNDMANKYISRASK